MNPTDPFSVVRGAIRASATTPPATSESEVTTRPVITISRQAGLDAGAVAERLAERLNDRLGADPMWKSYDQLLIVLVARELNLPAEFVASHDEQDESVIEHAMHGLSGESNPESVALKTGATIRHLSEQGRAIIVGRGGQSILTACERAVHVRLIAPESWRAEAQAGATGISTHAALKTIRKIDAERTRYVKAHYNHDPSDPLLYDIIVNMSKVGVAQAADAIVNLVPEESAPR